MQLEHDGCQKNALAIALAAVEIDHDPHGHQLHRAHPPCQRSPRSALPGATPYHGAARSDRMRRLSCEGCGDVGLPVRGDRYRDPGWPTLVGYANEPTRSPWPRPTP